MSYDSAFAYVKSCRPCIKPNSGFVKCLKDWEVKCSSSHRSQSISAPPPMRRAQTESVIDIPLCEKTIYLTGIRLSGYCQFVDLEPPNFFPPLLVVFMDFSFLGRVYIDMHETTHTIAYLFCCCSQCYVLYISEYLSCNNIHFLASESGNLHSVPIWRVHVQYPISPSQFLFVRPCKGCTMFVITPPQWIFGNRMNVNASQGQNVSV